MASVDNVTCPFCSLLCDDLSIRARAARLEVSTNACRLARQGFSAPQPASKASIKGVPATTGQAVRAAAALMQKSRKPLVGGLGTDVNGQRAALQLAEKIDAALLHAQEPYAALNLKAVQARGAIMTTLAEVKNRADTVIFVGNNVTGSHPRFIERCINTPHSLFAGKHRKLGYLGRPGRAELDGCDDHELVTVAGRGNEIADNLARLRAGIANAQLPDARRTAAPATRKLQQLVEMIGAAQYGTLVWNPAALPQGHADLVISACLDLVRDLNARQRFAGLSLGGNNGGVSWQSVATWQTGFPMGITFNDGRPSGAGVSLTDVDCLLWVSTFTDEPPPELDVPTIVLSPYPGAGHNAEVYIPVGIPGIDHGGNLFRTDGVINLPLKKLRDSGAHSTAGIIGRIVEQL